VLALSLELTRHQLGHDPTSSSTPVGGPIGILVLLAFASEGIWRLARHIGVIAHEGAHAVVGWSMGRKNVKVKLNSDATGVTFSDGPSTGMGVIITGFVGYLGPSIFGLCAAVLLAHHQLDAVLVVTGVSLFIMLLWVRNPFGFASVLINGGILVLAVGYGSVKLQTIAAYALSWFLLLSGVRFVLMHRSGAVDADILRGITHVPRIVWAALWLVITVIALWAGGRLLISTPVQ
jgi:peptidase M50B-like protein